MEEEEGEMDLPMKQPVSVKMEPDSTVDDEDLEMMGEVDEPRRRKSVSEDKLSRKEKRESGSSRISKKESKESKGSKGSKGSKPRKESSLSNKQQHLFLMEFLVDTVTIDPCSVDDEVLEGQTCLTLTFLNFQPMEICEKDFDPNRESGMNKVRFNCGKSLMFAFNEKQCDRPPPLLVEITVSKKLEDEENPCKVDIGTIKICISELFRQIVEVVKFKPDKLPTSKSIKDCYMLIGPGKRTMGDVSVYIRLSCLGQNVVTEFQCGPDIKSSPVLFKSREGKKVFEFKGNEPEDEEESPTSPMKPGCGCMSPQSQAYRGGQGDAGRSVGTAYTKGNRVVLDLPEKSNRCQGKHNIDRYKVSNKCGDYKVTHDSMMDNTRTKDGLTVSQMNTNPDQNCFVLNVGDKGQIPDRGKMILEFRTPKQKILPKVLPPYHEDVGVQTDSQKKGKGKKKKTK